MLVAVSARTGNNLVEMTVCVLYDHGNVVGVAGGGGVTACLVVRGGLTAASRQHGGTQRADQRHR